ncbi:MAG: Crp/Fnr family transcriptional regulator [Gracilibacteraceae bacterium]|jgi:CRP-like cAMP-binding protein|nr:Crp/Fnr family transcriptional regulator [Gracilibacteraceae bacterium]
MHETPLFSPIVSYGCFDMEPLAVKYGTRFCFPPKTHVLRGEDAVKDFHYIAEGRVHYVLNGYCGEERILLVLEAGSFFGATPTLNKISTSSTDCVTECESVIYQLEKTVFFHLMETSPVFCRSLIKGLSKGFHILKRQLESLSFSPCRERLLELLTASADKSVLLDGCWHPLLHQYSQSDMAKIINASRVTVSNIINDLCRDKHIRIVNRKIQVKQQR